MDIASHIRDIPDYPKPGIMFKDITPLLGNRSAFDEAITAMTTPHADAGLTAIVGIESRGFIFGAAMALRLGVGFVPVRKPGKLPAKTISKSYDLEYGSDTLEIHEDALGSDDRVIIVDDVLATGGTLAASVDLVRSLGATVLGAGILIELAFLDGRAKVDCPIHATLIYS
jgi:adenine phosphoribosyltransferase